MLGHEWQHIYLLKWIIHAVYHCCSDLASAIIVLILAGQPPVLVLSDGQFEMTAHAAAVLNRVYARHKHHEPVANIFGGSQAKLIVAYTKNRSIRARLIRACL
jgi:ABC-type histidine transport system ATPase subunit